MYLGSVRRWQPFRDRYKTAALRLESSPSNASGSRERHSRVLSINFAGIGKSHKDRATKILDFVKPGASQAM